MQVFVKNLRFPFICILRPFSSSQDNPFTMTDFMSKLTEGPGSTLAFLQSTPDKAQLFASLDAAMLDVFGELAFKDALLTKEYLGLWSKAPPTPASLGVNSYIKLSLKCFQCCIKIDVDFLPQFREMHEAVGAQFAEVTLNTFIIYTSFLRKLSQIDSANLLSPAFAIALHRKSCDFLLNFNSAQNYYTLLNLVRVDRLLQEFNYPGPFAVADQQDFSTRGRPLLNRKEELRSLSIKPAFLKLIGTKLSSKELLSKRIEDLSVLLSSVALLFSNTSDDAPLLSDRVQIFDAVTPMIESQLIQNSYTLTSETVCHLYSAYAIMNTGSPSLRGQLRSEVEKRLPQLKEIVFLSIMELYVDCKTANPEEHKAMLEPYLDELEDRIRQGMRIKSLQLCVARFSREMPASLVNEAKARICMGANEA